jgi:hypothetical protein
MGSASDAEAQIIKDPANKAKDTKPHDRNVFTIASS